MTTSAAAMVVLIDDTIATRLSGSAAGVKAAGDAAAHLEFFTMDELKKLRREYALLATQAASSTGGLAIATITNIEPS